MDHRSSNANLLAAEAESNRQWVEQWKRVGPELARIRARELRAYDYKANLPIIEGLLEIGVRFGSPRLTSGMVDFYRKLNRTSGE